MVDHSRTNNLVEKLLEYVSGKLSRRAPHTHTQRAVVLWLVRSKRFDSSGPRYYVLSPYRIVVIAGADDMGGSHARFFLLTFIMYIRYIGFYSNSRNGRGPIMTRSAGVFSRRSPPTAPLFPPSLFAACCAKPPPASTQRVQGRHGNNYRSRALAVFLLGAFRR